MIIEVTDLCRHAGIEQQTLDAWIEAGWIRPQIVGGSACFSDMDVARAQLIRDLAGPIDINAEGVGIILDLLDQIHGLRWALESLTTAVAGQHLSVRRRIRSHVERLTSSPARAARRAWTPIEDRAPPSERSV
jgi:chaperone modulatory protein CbpM